MGRLFQHQRKEPRGYYVNFGGQGALLERPHLRDLLAQTLIVTAGCGLHQRWGGPIEEIRPGDVVTVGPNEKHWHGAAPTTAMTHIAIQEAKWVGSSSTSGRNRGDIT